MDKTYPVFLPEGRTEESPAPLAGYTLYPDAGDFGGLDAAPVLPDPPPTVLPSVPETVPPAHPAAAPPVPAPAASGDAPPLRYPASGRAGKVLLRCAMGAMAAAGILVYADLLLAGGQALWRSGLGTWAVGEVFGGREGVTALPTNPPEPGPAETGDPGEREQEILPMESAPPANEQAQTPPASDVLTRDLSSRQPGGLGLINETPYTPDLAALSRQAPTVDSYAALESVYGKGTPAVLILHTHGTEAFADFREEGYHTVQESRSVRAVGQALAETLEEAGIGVIHCTELFDDPSFDMAYYNAAAYIRGALEEYPSIRYILDVHRDAITAEDGTGIRPLISCDGIEYAQMMFVVGTDHGGSGHTGWETNLALAARLQSALHGEYPGLMRDINLRSASFNAQYAPGALLIEAGAACSELSEAIRSVRVLGQALAEEILQTSPAD